MHPPKGRGRRAKPQSSGCIDRRHRSREEIVVSRRALSICASMVIIMLPVLGLGARTANATGSQAPVTITWWSSDNAAFVAANKVMIARFAKANPSIHVKLQYFPYLVLIRKLQAGYRAHNVADMQQMFGTWVTQYAQNGLLDPVPSSFASKEGKGF